LKRAVCTWKANGIPLAFTLNLGDLLDGFTTKTNQGSEAAWLQLMGALQELDCPVHHTLGNHELYCFDRQGWRERFNIISFYYSFTPHHKLLFVNLDCYDISTLGATDEENARRACQYMANNPNEDPNSPLNMEGLSRRFVKYNGGVGRRQLEWLDYTLSEARRSVG